MFFEFHCSVIFSFAFGLFAVIEYKQMHDMPNQRRIYIKGMDPGKSGFDA